MLEEDRLAIRKMKDDFTELGRLAEDGFKGYNTFERRMNHYNTVYMAATRNTPSTSDYPGYDAGELLYMEYQEMLTTYLWKYRNLSVTSEMELFKTILQVWDHYNVLLKWNMRAFAYLSRYYIVNHTKPSLRQIGLSIFLEQIFKKNAAVVSRVTQQLLFQERAGESVNKTQIGTAIRLLSSMSVEDTQSIYITEFLKPYLEKTTQDYEALLKEWDKEDDGALFLEIAQEALDKERARCRSYFSLHDEERIMNCVEDVVIDSPTLTRKLLLSTDGVVSMLQRRDETMLSKVFSLFSRRKAGIAQLASLIKRQIQSEGSSLAAQFKNEEAAVDVVSYVTQMMQLQEIYPRLLSVCFQLDFELSKAVREGLEVCYSGGVEVKSASSGQSRIVPFCEWLSHYENLVLQKSGGPAVSEIERIVSTLTFLTERDRFLTTSREHMSDRILFPAGKLNMDHEKTLVQRIRQRCGPASTSYLEGMLRDSELSTGLHAMDMLAASGERPPFEVSLFVGKRGIWPARLLKSTEICVPLSLRVALDALRQNYLSDKARRVLLWSHEGSSAEVTGVFGDKKQDFFVCGIQALVLLAFNDSEMLQVGEVATRYCIPLETLLKAVPPLLRAKVLSLTSSERSVTAESILQVNSEYICRPRKVRLPASLTRISIAATESISKQVEEDRRPAIDACIIRIMKGRRILEHADLVSECQQLLAPRFTPDVKSIKQRIEELIRKEYLCRNAQNPGLYTYIA